MEPRISLVTLGVRDVDRSRACYEGLGWSGEPPDGSVVFFQAGGMILGLWDRRLLGEDSAVTDGGGWGGVTLAHNVGSPAEVDDLLAEAVSCGATLARPASATPWGGYSGVFVDPEGHPWEVAHNPGWVLADDGTVRLR